MNNQIGKFIVDTNVPLTANLALNIDEIEPAMIGCVSACVNAIDSVVKNQNLVIDNDDEIFDEYRHKLSLRGSPGQGDRFMKWVHDRRWSLPADNRVSITKNGDSYEEFPDHEELSEFDLSDRKFVAVSNAHADKPPILQATDSKWWGWKDALAEVEIKVEFLCETWIKKKYAEKME